MLLTRVFAARKFFAGDRKQLHLPLFGESERDKNRKKIHHQSLTFAAFFDASDALCVFLFFCAGGGGLGFSPM